MFTPKKRSRAQEKKRSLSDYRTMAFNMLNEDFFEMLVNTGSEGAEGVLKILDEPARWLYKDPAASVLGTAIMSDAQKERLNLLIRRFVIFLYVFLHV